MMSFKVDLYGNTFSPTKWLQKGQDKIRKHAGYWPSREESEGDTNATRLENTNLGYRATFLSHILRPRPI
jgi:hypothetical protein